MNLLTRADGPECVRCGCQDSEVLDTREWRGAVWEVRRCNHCGHRFSWHAQEANEDLEPVADSVQVVVIQCPNCGAEWPPAVSTPAKGRRRHKCKECGHPFKSIEKKQTD